MSADRDHLDAETLAAWMDGGLDGEALKAAEAHASDCARCRGLLAAMVRTEPPLPAAASPVTSAFSRIRWWFAPLAAAAAAVTLWMVVPDSGTREAALRPDQVRPGADRTASPAPAGAPPANEAAARDTAETPAPAERAQQAAKAVPAAPAPAAPLVAQAEPLAAASELKREAPAAAPERQALADSVGAVAKATEESADLRARAGARPEMAERAAPVVVVSPAPASQWRAVDRSIERSEDGGRTWLPVGVAVADAITAGASPAPLACWFVGRNGLVLLATDGTNFTRVPFPARVDLTSVTSAGASSATVTAADGRTFLTADAGLTWRQP